MIGYIIDTVEYPLPLEDIIDTLADMGYIITAYRVHYPGEIVSYSRSNLHTSNADLLSTVMAKHTITLIHRRTVELDVWVKQEEEVETE